VCYGQCSTVLDWNVMCDMVRFCNELITKNKTFNYKMNRLILKRILNLFFDTKC
jgi:hypothetical protein